MRFPLARTAWLLLVCLPFAATADEPAPATEIRTPAAPAVPRINGPRVYGERPGRPFFYHLPVTGERPMKYAAASLPSGLSLDPDTGNITGTTDASGTHPVEFTVTNAKGSDKATINLVIGDQICLTPPLGWNSWNHFARNVSEAAVRGAADAMVSSGLAEHGWTYVNIDDCWQGERDAAGVIHGNQKFPDLKPLGDYIHGKGLKFGVYSSPGPKTCAGFNATYQHEDQDARTYADWGVDYVKYDLCSYEDMIRAHLRDFVETLLPEDQRLGFVALSHETQELDRTRNRTPEQEARRKEANAQYGKIIAGVDSPKLKAFRLEEEQAPYRVFGQSLAKVNRDIAYSFCQYGRGGVSEWGASLGGNCWRTTGDINASWGSMTRIGFEQDRLAKYAGPGHWNDPDMLEIGNKGLSPDECYTHMTLWCVLSAPLLIGCDMTTMDPLTVSMFSNDEVIAVNQDALGMQGHRVKADGTSEVWIKPLKDGTTAVALFNRGEAAADVGVSWDELKRAGASLASPPETRDLWRQKPFSAGPEGVTMLVAAHGAELLRVGSLTAAAASP